MISNFLLVCLGSLPTAPPNGASVYDPILEVIKVEAASMKPHARIFSVFKINTVYCTALTAIIFVHDCSLSSFLPPSHLKSPTGGGGWVVVGKRGVGEKIEQRASFIVHCKILPYAPSIALMTRRLSSPDSLSAPGCGLSQSRA